MTDCRAEPLLRGLRGGPGMRGRGRGAPRAAAPGWRLGGMPPNLTERSFRVGWGFFFGGGVCALFLLSFLFFLILFSFLKKFFCSF